MPLFSSKNNRYVVFFTLIFIFNFFISCSDNNQKKSTKPEEVQLKQEFKDKIARQNEDSHMLLESACLYCHRIEDYPEEEVAPKMQVIRDVYKGTYPDRQAFIDAFVKFSVQPSEELSIMQSAIDQYGLMEDAGHTKDDIEDIADYLFDYQFQ